MVEPLMFYILILGKDKLSCNLIKLVTMTKNKNLSNILKKFFWGAALGFGCSVCTFSSCGGGATLVAACRLHSAGSVVGGTSLAGSHHKGSSRTRD